MDEFVHNFIASNESNDLDLAVSFYALNVDPVRRRQEIGRCDPA